MKHWESLVDRMVKEAIGNGDISHLPGAGKPLDLKIDENTPNDQRVMYKIMQDHNLAPDWIMAGKALDDIEEKLRKQIAIRASRYRREYQAAQKRGAILEEIEIEEKWALYAEDFTDRVGRYNKEVLSYNLAVPKSIPHKQIIIADQLIARALKVEEGD